MLLFTFKYFTNFTQKMAKEMYFISNPVKFGLHHNGNLKKALKQLNAFKEANDEIECILIVDDFEFVGGMDIEEQLEKYNDIINLNYE